MKEKRNKNKEKSRKTSKRTLGKEKRMRVDWIWGVTTRIALFTAA